MTQDTSESVRLPIFPNFDKLRFEQKRQIEEFTAGYSSYSDFSFTNLWTWDTDGSTRISVLNHNLVVKMLNYTGEYLILTFIGDGLIDETIRTLIDFAKSTNLPETLELLPEPIIKKIESPDSFKIVEDINNSDYILSSGDIASLQSPELKKHKKKVGKLRSGHGEFQFEVINLKDERCLDEIRNLNDLWIAQTPLEKVDPDEKTAILRALNSASDLGIIGLGCRFENNLIGFALVEFLNAEYGLLSFEKADKTYIGIYSILNQFIAQFFVEQGRKYINMEQDLGKEGLRRSKKSWKPVSMLKKYSVSLKDSQ